MATMSPTARPLTPFPHTHHTHVLTHGHSASYFHYQPEPYAQTSRPIHFHMRSLPVHTPPSLLRRRSSGKSTVSSDDNAVASSSSHKHARTSSSVSSSDFGLAPMPELLHPTPRRVSTCSTSSASESDAASPPMPTTPVLGAPSAAPPTPLALPPPAYPKRTKAIAMPSPELELEHYEHGQERSPLSSFHYDPYSTSTSDGVTVASFYPHSESATTPRRPQLKRRDTPRPQATTLSSLGMSQVIQDDEEERKVFRSVIDGGRWVIIG